jgi:hypothetical protein
MGTILSTSSAKMAGGAGIGAKVLAWLLPFKFFAWFFWAITLLPMLPGMLLRLKTVRLEQNNYRDAAGFRARLYHDWRSRMVWTKFPLLIVAQGLLMGVVMYTEPIFGIKTCYLGIAALLAPVIFFAARRLVIASNWFHIATLVSCLILMAGLLAIGLGFLPVSAMGVCMTLYMVAFVIGYGARPLRMDYNLFLRSSQKLLEVTPAESGLAEAVLQLSKSQLRAFARFLGNRWLVVGHHWQGRGLVLRVPPIQAAFFNSVYWAFGNRGSIEFEA